MGPAPQARCVLRVGPYEAERTLTRSGVWSGARTLWAPQETSTVVYYICESAVQATDSAQNGAIGLPRVSLRIPQEPLSVATDTSTWVVPGNFLDSTSTHSGSLRVRVQRGSSPTFHMFLFDRAPLDNWSWDARSSREWPSTQRTCWICVLNSLKATCIRMAASAGSSSTRVQTL